MRSRAERLNAKANRLDEKGWHDEAEALYLKAHEADPEWSSPLFNLGLLTKNQRRWEDSLRYNERATRLGDCGEAAWWNLGIAATALGDWATARRAWAGFGLEIPEGEGPLELNIGPTPIRVSPEEAPEVVWCHRIDPARARILSVPFVDCGRRFHDLVLHDGAPNGYRNLEGRQLAVFDELELLEASSYSTYEIQVTAARPADLERLTRLARQLGAQAEDWTGSVEMVCQQCSKGIPHQHHLREAPPWTARRSVGVAARSRQTVDCLIEEWHAATESEADSIELLLPSEPR